MAGRKGPVSKKLLESMYHDEQLSLREIGGRIGRTPTNVLYWMRQHGIPSRTLAVANHLSGPKWSHDRNRAFFRTWSPEMAWVLGLMLSDGCVRRNSAYG